MSRVAANNSVIRISPLLALGEGGRALLAGGGGGGGRAHLAGGGGQTTRKGQPLGRKTQVGALVRGGDIRASCAPHLAIWLGSSFFLKIFIYLTALSLS